MRNDIGEKQALVIRRFIRQAKGQDEKITEENLPSRCGTLKIEGNMLYTAWGQLRRYSNGAPDWYPVAVIIRVYNPNSKQQDTTIILDADDRGWRDHTHGIDRNICHQYAEITCEALRPEGKEYGYENDRWTAFNVEAWKRFHEATAAVPALPQISFSSWLAMGQTPDNLAAGCLIDSTKEINLRAEMEISKRTKKVLKKDKDYDNFTAIHKIDDEIGVYEETESETRDHKRVYKYKRYHLTGGVLLLAPRPEEIYADGKSYYAGTRYTTHRGDWHIIKASSVVPLDDKYNHHWHFAFYISAVDNRTYFIAELSNLPEILSLGDIQEKGPFTMKRALLSMMPDEIKERKNVKRQGEWFFVPVNNAKQKELNRVTTEANVSLAPPRIITSEDEPHHTVTIYYKDQTGQYAKDTVSDHQHPEIKLGKRWHKIYHNVVVCAVSAEGNID